MEDRGSVLERGTTDRGVDDKSRGLSGGFRLEANAPVSLTQEEYDYLVAHGSPREWKEWRKKELRAQMEESGPLLQQHEIKEFDPDAPPPSQIKEYKPPEPPRTRWEQFTRVNLLWLRNIGEAFFGPLQVAAKADLGEPITEEDRAWAAFDAVTFGGGRAKTRHWKTNGSDERAPSIEAAGHGPHTGRWARRKGGAGSNGCGPPSSSIESGGEGPYR